MACSPPGSSVHGIFFRQEYWSESPESKIDLRTWQFNLDEVNISNHVRENGIFNKWSIKYKAGFLFFISTPELIADLSNNFNDCKDVEHFIDFMFILHPVPLAVRYCSCSHVSVKETGLEKTTKKTCLK